MVSIKTGSLRGQAEKLNREANRYNQRIAELEAVITWIRRQEFGEAKEELYRNLTRQREALVRQRRGMLLLAEALRRICDKAERTEQSIIEKGESYRRPGSRINSVDLIGIMGNLEWLTRILVK